MNFANHLWQSTLFALAPAMLAWLLRNKRARVRHALWLAASVKFLLPFSLLVVLGGRLPWLSTPKIATALPAVVTVVSQPFSVPKAVAALPETPNRLPDVLLTIWMVGFAGVALSWWVRWRRIAIAVRTASALDLDLPVRAVSCDVAVEPGVFGIVEPVLLLPAGIFEHLTPAQLQTVIAHEMVHVRHRDNLFAAFQMFVETVFWFHPLVWWIGRRMMEERERACDEAVLRDGSDPRIYAEAILNVCRFFTESRLACVPGVTGANLKERIEAIVSRKVASDLRVVQKVGLVFAGAVAILSPTLIGMMHAVPLLAQAIPQTAPAQTAIAPQSQAIPTPPAPPRKPPATRPAPFVLESQIQTFTVDPSADAAEQLPGRHATITYFAKIAEPVGIRVQLLVARNVILTVPLASLTGRVDIAGAVTETLASGADGQDVANVHDVVTAGAEARKPEWRVPLVLHPGRYRCRLAIKEETGRVYTESISFEVK